MKGRKGFTLLELLIAITLLAVIIAIGMNLINVGTTDAVSTADKVISDFNNVETAINYYKNARGNYPTYTCSQTPPVPVGSTCLSELVPYFLVAVPNVTGTIGWAKTNILYYNDNTTGNVYLCIVSQANLDRYQKESVSLVKSKTPLGKVYISTKCGAKSDNNYGNGSADITWWISKR